MFTNASTDRNLLLYVTIDPWDHRSKDNMGGHQPNFSRLQQVAQSWNENTEVVDLWAGHLTDEHLCDQRLLAVFLSGSFTEWREVFQHPAWRELLDQLCTQIKSTHMPILAVCGSHQLVACAYGGWDAIGHMAAKGHAAIPISTEAHRESIDVALRPSEIGVYAFHLREAGDPLLNGLPDPVCFVEYHRDEVLFVPPGTAPLLSPSLPAGHSPLQALRYEIEPSGRVLYTLQFHPELMWWEPDPNATSASENGARLIENFLTIAQKYWHDQTK